MLQNISQVKKYEQSQAQIKGQKNKKKIFFSLFISLNCIAFIGIGLLGLSAEVDKSKESVSGSLEITEKYYKKEAILNFNAAVELWNQKKVDEAISYWEKATGIDPALWSVYLGLGQAYEQKKEFTRALKSYQKFLELAPEESPDKKTVVEVINYLNHLLRYGEENITGNDYLSLMKTKYEGKDLFVRWELDKPLNIYFYPAVESSGYKKGFEDAFLKGAGIWQEALPELMFHVLDNSVVKSLSGKKRTKKEKEILDKTQIKVIFPSEFTEKGNSMSSSLSDLEAYSYPVIRDKKNFRVLGKIMISPYIYYQAQIAISLKPLSELSEEKKIKHIKLNAARETGHVLGLWGFSPNPDDLLFEGEVIELKLSRRDKNTIKKLYMLNPEENEVLTNK